MRRLWVCVLLCICALAGIALGQDTPEQPLFVLERQIGEQRPSGIQYDVNFDQFVWVDPNGQLVLSDAATYSARHVLYTTGVYNAYTFSPDGRYLALAIERRVELWNTQTGERAALFEPTGALQANGPLFFSPDGGLLLINTLVPAPPELRRSENDTANLPWLWDAAYELDEAPSTLPRRADAVPFYDYRNGLAIGGNRTLVGGVPSRLRVVDGTTNNWHVYADIDSTRLERDPIYVWRSATDEYLYIDPRGSNFVQVDTENRTTVTLPLGQTLGYQSAERRAGAVRFSRIAQTIGAASNFYQTSLGRLLYGEGYTAPDVNPMTLMLLDVLQPLTVDRNQFALLVYVYAPNQGQGTMEIIRLGDITHLLLHPDGQRLIVRRGSERQPIEIYDIASGVLERTIVPSEPNVSDVFALTSDGKTLVVDFQRFDLSTGDLITEQPAYARRYDTIRFSDTTASLYAWRGGTLNVIDTETGAVDAQAVTNVRGSELRRSPDNTRYLTRSDTDAGVTLEIYEVISGARRAVTLPNLPNRSVETIIPRDDWQQFIVTYGSTNTDPSGDIAVWDFAANRLMYTASRSLPPGADRSVGWVDDYTVYVSTNSQTAPSEPVYGLDYHDTGVPRCLISAYPTEWQLFIGVWDSLNVRLSADQYERLNRQVCAKLPEAAATVVPGLTPTPRFYYEADVLRIRAGVPDVPSCLTRAFPSEQLQYGELWRTLSAGLSDAEKETLADLLCEGLITSLRQIAATPTVNPNLLYAATATPIADAPETVAEREFGLGVMLIDVATAQRQFGTFIPTSSRRTTTDVTMLYNFYVNQTRTQPASFTVSADGTRVALFDEQGFIRIYRLTKPYHQLVAEEQAAAAQRAAESPRDIGLPATPTPEFYSIGLPLPTLTPTVTPTRPAPEAITVEPTIIDVCPARTLYSLTNLPPEYAASGRLLTTSPAGDSVVWAFEPESGLWRPDMGLPTCYSHGNCQFSADGEWLLHYDGDNKVSISRFDGSDRTTLFTGAPDDYILNGISFVGQHQLEYRVQGWLPERFASPVTLIGRYDPETGAETPLAYPTPYPTVTVGDLPVSIMAAQPRDGSLLLLAAPYRTPDGGNNGTRYYIYDLRDGSSEYISRIDYGSLRYEWPYPGTTLFYWREGVSGVFAYDTATKTHTHHEDSPFSGDLAPDLRQIVAPLWRSSDTYDQRLKNGELPLKIGVWDTETHTLRRYCVPETGAQDISALRWSPDSRYVAFTVMLPAGGDAFPTPVGEDTPTPPPATPVSLETQYDLQFARTVILDTQTGFITVLGKLTPMTGWIKDTP